MNWRRMVVFWAALSVALGWASIASAQLPDQTVKGFKLPEYDAEGRLVQRLFGETATFLQDGIIKLTGLTIELFRNGEMTARITSPECAYDPNRKRAASKEHIRIVTEKAVLTGDGFAWNGENEQFQIFMNAKVVLDSQVDAVGMLAPRGTPGTDAAPSPAE